MTPTEIKSLRKSLGWTQQRLAADVGASLRAIQYWEAGERTPTGPAIKLLERLRDEVT